MRRTLALGLVPLLMWGAVACSESLSSGELERRVTERLAELTDVEDPQVTCPEDLPAEVGATTQCRMNDGERVLPVDVTVTAEDGDEVTFDVEVGPNPIG